MKTMTRRAAICSGAMALLGLAGCNANDEKAYASEEFANILPEPTFNVDENNVQVVDYLDPVQVFSEFTSPQKNIYFDFEFEKSWSVIQPGRVTQQNESGYSVADGVDLKCGQRFYTVFGRRDLSLARTSISCDQTFEFCREMICESAMSADKVNILVSDVELRDGVEIQKSVVKFVSGVEETEIERHAVVYTFMHDGFAMFIYAMDTTDSQLQNIKALESISIRMVSSFNDEDFATVR